MMTSTIAVFHNTAQVGSAWCCAEGISAELRKKGHRVLDFGNPRFTKTPLSELKRADAIIMGAPEWFFDAILEQYGNEWHALKAPKAAWYAETAHRDDQNFDFRKYLTMADLHYYPAEQDAREFGGTWLPFGTDEGIFRPLPGPKVHDVAFIGSMYPKRLEFIKNVDYPITILPQVHADNVLESFARLNEAYNSTKVFVNMPAYSRLLVTKVTEVMASRTMLVTPKLDHPSALANMAQFQDGKHLVYYDADSPKELGEILTYYSNHQNERDAIATNGWKEVIEKHTLSSRVDTILADIQAISIRTSSRKGFLQRVLAKAAAALG